MPGLADARQPGHDGCQVASPASLSSSTFAPHSSTPTFSPALRLVAPADQRSERGRTAGLGGDAQAIPQQPLRLDDRVVGNERDVIDVRLRDVIDELPGVARAERIRRDALDRHVDRAAGFE